MQGPLTDQKACGASNAIAGCHHPVAGADEIGILKKFKRRQGGIVAGQEGLLPGRLDRDRDARVRIGEQDHAGGAFAHARDAAHQTDAIHRGPAVADAVAGAHVQKDRLPEGRAGIRQHDAGDMGKLRVEPDLIEVEEARVLLFQLQRRLAPGLHLLEFAAQFLVLFVKAGVALEFVDHRGGLRHGQERPIEGGDHAIHQRGAEAFDAGGIDPPEQEQAQQEQHQKAHEQPAQGACVILWSDVARLCHGVPFSDGPSLRWADPRRDQLS